MHYEERPKLTKVSITLRVWTDRQMDNSEGFEDHKEVIYYNDFDSWISSLHSTRLLKLLGKEFNGEYTAIVGFKIEEKEMEIRSIKSDYKRIFCSTDND